MHIDRCVCYNITFEQLKTIQQNTGATSIQDLQQHLYFGGKCEMCHRYVSKMLRTGQTVFHELLDEAN